MIEIILPIRLQSPNVKEHWTKTYKRNKRVAQVVGFTLWTNSEVCALRDKLWSNTKVAKNGKNSFNGFKIKITLVLSLIHISEPTRLLSISYAVFCLKKK